jgi:Signal peptidase, peptidase S26
LRRPDESGQPYSYADRSETGAGIQIEGQTFAEQLDGLRFQALETREPVNPARMMVEVPEGMVYVVGDNRQNSLDSRFFGPVPVASIKGRARWIWLWFDGRHRSMSGPRTLRRELDQLAKAGR